MLFKRFEHKHNDNNHHHHPYAYFMNAVVSGLALKMKRCRLQSAGSGKKRGENKKQIAPGTQTTEHQI